MYEIIYQDIEENSKYEKTIKKVVEKCFEEEGISDSKLCLTVTLTNPENIRKINKEYGHSFERELSYMVVHGFYHVMGYDHIKEEDKVKMRPKEEKILNDLKILREC